MNTLASLYDARVAEGRLIRDDAQEATLSALERIRAELAAAPELPKKRGLFRRAPEVPKVRGLYLWGGVGRGKSMLMDLFVDSLNVPVRRVHFHAFMQEMQADLHRLRGEGVEDPVNPMAKAVSDSVRVLAFDEMQITDIADAMLVGRLFEQLFEAGTVVVTTSNRKPDDLYKDGLNRQLFLPFIALIKDRLEVRELASERDHRQNRLRGARSYFTPVDAAARAEIDALWADLTHGEEEQLVLTVKGRKIALPRYRNGMARVSFYDMCGQMLGPGDYLAIADALRLLVLENVPRLGRSNFNEAKRFATLIDTLYEARVKLIVSARDTPESLYIEGPGAFEFERTASRLNEMQAEDWAEDWTDEGGKTS
ncbi:ATPase [Salipiger aestuarii]|uniref:cell division protein ZapE n=1 Tax=Salipiger aestuarii TaxID=568098 RepID=UPI00025B69CF|nr:cell division protein ZapE [Salipiger aestuarii]EIE51838.1 AFG1 family ATPase [Citreicella sp. 357]KAA8608049.1 ATPase [Salipiger aestuarii]